MVTTSRRDRPPTGQVNARPPTDSSNPSARMLFSSRKSDSSNLASTYPPVSGRVTGRETERSNNDGGQTDRSTISQLSTNEVLRRMREKSDFQKNQLDSEEINALGPYNAFSRPRPSQVAPLRTVLLDPSVNNFPRSRTRTELLRRIKTTCNPHPSYDLDRDGYVSQEDYRLSKRFDFDGNGVLDPDERAVGRRILSQEFFKRHQNDLQNFGPSFEGNTVKQNVDKLVNSYSFERSYDKLLSIERTLIAESSKPLLDCIRNDNDPNFQKNKYFTDKFDSTAWTDYDRMPRSTWMPGTVCPPSRTFSSSVIANNIFPSNNTNTMSNTQLNEHDHGGSRRRLLFTRKEIIRQDSQQKLLDKMDGGGGGTFSATGTLGTTSGNGRMNLISDVRVENS